MEAFFDIFFLITALFLPGMKKAHRIHNSVIITDYN